MKRFNHLLDLQQRGVKPVFVSSYIPRKCGIATFCKDLTTAMNDLNPEGLAKIMALDEEGVHDLAYPPEVIGHIPKQDRAAYKAAAELINQSDAEIVCLQHEFGLMGTDYPAEWVGEYILDFLRAVDKPIVTTFHTILENPTKLQRETFTQIAELSDIMIAMLPNAHERLEQVYGISSNRIVIVPHGVTDRPRASRHNKVRFGWDGRKVLLMSGLLSPGKGAEYVIQALPEIVKKCPEALFVLVGQTHPDVLRNVGEAYREGLVSMAETLGVGDHVQFINEYLPLETLLDYYEACDIYLTPHLDPQQVASGTLAYALGMGKACVSTEYIYAKAMLADGRGELVGFRDAPAIAEACLRILSDPSYQDRLERAAYALGRTMSWPRVAQRYLNLFRLVLDVQDEVLAEEAPVRAL